MTKHIVTSVCFVGVSVAAGCGDDSASESDATERPASVATTTSVLAVPSEGEGSDGSRVDELVGIGGGRELHLRCEGIGSPTVVLEAGDESGIEDWSRVAPALVEETRTCAYDRLGTGTSSPAEGCRQLDDILDDLDALLLAADVPGPYVFVGASGGGYLAVGMAERHVDELAGIVLAETPQAIPPAIAAEIAAEISCDAPANVERRDYAAVEHAVWDDRHLIADVPVRIISDTSNESELGNAETQEGWLVLSPQASQVTVSSGHDVPINQPEVVIDAILEVINLARESD
jgi:alpha/beta hydrolase fold